MQSAPGNLEQVVRHTDAARREDPKHSLQPKHSLRSWAGPRSRGRPWHALFKGCNAVPGHLGRSLRARREAVMPKALAAAKAFATLMGWAPLMGQALRFVAPFDKDRAKAGPTSTASAVGLACKACRATNHFTSRCIHQSLVVRPLYTARFFLVLDQIRGHLNSYE